MSVNSFDDAMLAAGVDPPDLPQALEAGHPVTIEAGHRDLPLFLDLAEAAELRRCEAVIKEGEAAFIAVGQALGQIRDSRLYREEFGTFDEYLEKRWNGISKSKAHRDISAARIYERLEAGAPKLKSPIGDGGETVLPTSASQVRSLSQLAEDQQPQAWQAAVEQAGGQPTAAQVQEVVTGMLPPRPEKADAAVAPLFTVEADPETKSRFSSPGPVPALNPEGDNAPSNDAKSAAETLAALNKDRDETVKEWSENDATDDGQNGEEAEDDADQAASAADMDPAGKSREDVLAGAKDGALPKPAALPDGAGPAADADKERGRGADSSTKPAGGAAPVLTAAKSPASAIPSVDKKPAPKPIHPDAPHTSPGWDDSEREDFEANLPALKVAGDFIAGDFVAVSQPRAMAVITLTVINQVQAVIVLDALAACGITLSEWMTAEISSGTVFDAADAPDFLAALEGLSGMPVAAQVRLCAECLMRSEIDQLGYKQGPLVLGFLMPKTEAQPEKAEQAKAMLPAESEPYPYQPGQRVETTYAYKDVLGNFLDTPTYSPATIVRDHGEGMVWVKEDNDPTPYKRHLYQVRLVTEPQTAPTPLTPVDAPVDASGKECGCGPNWTCFMCRAKEAAEDNWAYDRPDGLTPEGTDAKYCARCGVMPVSEAGAVCPLCEANNK